MSSIAIIGAGQIGSRHLQALAAMQDEASIRLVDPARASLERAAQRWAEAGGTRPLELVEDLDAVGDEVDVAIIATSADVRRVVTERLLARTRVRFIVFEKVLFQSLDDYGAIAALLCERGTTAFVNCPRRQWPVYREFRARHGALGRVGFHVDGAGWGLACNVVHFVDLFAFLTGQDDLALSAEALVAGSVPAKRPGFVELNGALRGTARDGSHVSFTHHAAGGAPPTIVLASEHLRAVFMEAGRCLRMSRAEDGWSWTEHPLQPRNQSELTHLVVRDLVSRGTCELTPFEQSSRHHVAVIEAFLEHLSRTSQLPVHTCPIT